MKTDEDSLMSKRRKNYVFINEEVFLKIMILRELAHMMRNKYEVKIGYLLDDKYLISKYIQIIS